MNESSVIKKMKRYYKLLIIKSKKQINLKLMTEKDSLYKDAVNICGGSDIPMRWNNCYTFCTNRQLLKDCAILIKKDWVKELELELELIKEIKF